MGVRNGLPNIRPRTQAQLAITADDQVWWLLNASPDLRQQVLTASEFAPTGRMRGSPIVGVVLTSAEVDFVIGLLHLREFHPLTVYSTAGVRRVLTEGNTLFRALDRSMPPVEWRDLPLGKEVVLQASRPTGVEVDLRCIAVGLDGEYPDYVDQELKSGLASEEAVIGLSISAGPKAMFYAPGLSPRSKSWKGFVLASDLALLDGTFWSNDELPRFRCGSKTAREMGHLPLSGDNGLLQELKDTTRPRRVAIHINNTNPILDEDSPEHRAMRDAGWEIALDGMEFDL